MESSLQRISSKFLLWKRNDLSCKRHETIRLVNVSFVNVILTRQTCGRRSSRAAKSKRQALGNYFPERICYMFPVSKFRGDRDLGLCTFFELANGEPLRNGDFRKKTCFARRKNQNLALRSGSLFASTQKVYKVTKQCIDLDVSLLYILISGI